VAADLKVRAPGCGFEAIAMDLLDPGAISETVRELSAGRNIAVALVAHGSLPEQASCEDDTAAVQEALNVNAVSPALWAEALASAMQRQGRGSLALIGSVAGDRGRRSNYVYGAAKGLLDRYAQGLQHRLAGSGVSVTLVKPGPTETPMTASMAGGKLKLAPVEQVSAAIVSGIEKRAPVVYAPGKWRLIMLILRHMPRFIFNRLDI